MNILLATNKTYKGVDDLGKQYTYEPLMQLGHKVYWYDTVAPQQKDLNKIIDVFKPDIIFCCLTGNPWEMPAEPIVIESVKRETVAGRTKTFNWFCDDTWRFGDIGAEEVGSSTICHEFNVCSTSEPSYVDKYKKVGYENIILATWHANEKYYKPIPFQDRDMLATFIGRLNPTRKAFFDSVSADVNIVSGISNQEMFRTHCRSKIGINLSVNNNDPNKRTQMKQRMFEIVAGGGLLMTEHHDGLEEFFEIDKEIITFKTAEEFSSKFNFLKNNENIVEKIAKNGHERFLKEHTSHKRLEKLLEQIRKI